MGYVTTARITKLILKKRHKLKYILLYLYSRILYAAKSMARSATIKVKLRNIVTANTKLMTNNIKTAVSHLGYILN